MGKWIRHGDVILDIVDEVKCKQKKATEEVLAEGEVTGHKHILSGQMLVGMDGGHKYATILGETELRHDDHNTLVIPEGKSVKVSMQREVDLLGQVRQVLD